MGTSSDIVRERNNKTNGPNGSTSASSSTISSKTRITKTNTTSTSTSFEETELDTKVLQKIQFIPDIHTLVRTSRIRTKYKSFILSSIVFEVEQRYKVQEIIGHGAYGTVCSGYDLALKQYVAIKKIENIFAHKSLAKRTLRELKLLRYFTHENIISLSRVMRPNKSNSIYMVSELMETDLAMVIRSQQSLTDEHVQFFLYQVLRGLKYIHSASVIHRDLKPRNLLVNSNCDLKICDFGLARTISTDDDLIMSNYIATRWYRAPEVILSQSEYTQAVDMWAMGCILAELLIRRPLFPGRDSFHQISLIISILGTPAEDKTGKKNHLSLSSRTKRAARSKSKRKKNGFMRVLPKKPSIPFNQVIPNATPLALDLLSKLLLFDAEKRLTVDQALAHPYLKDFHFPDDEPICDTLDLHDFYFEYFKTTTEDMQILTQQEILCNYPEDTFQFHEEPKIQFFTQTGRNIVGRRRSFP